VTTGTLDRRTALALVLGVALVLVLRFVVFADKQPKVVAASDSIPLAEKRLAKLRAIAASVPGKETVLKQVSGELSTREKGVLLAGTAPQAQAQLLEIIRRAGKDEGIDVRGAEEMKVRPLAEDYGEVLVAVAFTCRIDQLINFLATLANRPELLATNDIRVTAGNPKDKTLNVRLELSGVVRRELVPKKAEVQF